MKKLIVTLCVAGAIVGATSSAFARRSSHRSRKANVAKPMAGNKATQPVAVVAPLPAAAAETPAAATSVNIAALNVSGTITALDALGHSLELDGQKFTVRDAVEITVNGMTCLWTEDKIKVGAKATVNYTASGGKVLFVNKITAQSAPAKPGTI